MNAHTKRWCIVNYISTNYTTGQNERMTSFGVWIWAPSTAAVKGEENWFLHPLTERRRCVMSLYRLSYSSTDRITRGGRITSNLRHSSAAAVPSNVYFKKPFLLVDCMRFCCLFEIHVISNWNWRSLLTVNHSHHIRELGRLHNDSNKLKRLFEKKIAVTYPISRRCAVSPICGEFIFHVLDLPSLSCQRHIIIAYHHRLQQKRAIDFAAITNGLRRWAGEFVNANIFP